MRSSVILLSVAAVAAAACGSAVEAQPVIVYVSNQSFDIDPVDITVTVDGEVVVADDFRVEGQHNWVEFPLQLAGGEHVMEVSSVRGPATYLGTLQVDGPLWVVVDYWSGSDTEDGAPAFGVHISTEPVGFM
ncbi:MAG: hypothetical protein EHM57_00860 [Actinobacteria bacterium]|nr:MAG: hypothetical protein EHM57_00860 [Actinomycetota bacterium]